MQQDKTCGSIQEQGNKEHLSLAGKVDQPMVSEGNDIKIEWGVLLLLLCALKFRGWGREGRTPTSPPSACSIQSIVHRSYIKLNILVEISLFILTKIHFPSTIQLFINVQF